MAKRQRKHRAALQFFRAATQRFDEARFLLVRGTFTTAAIYLAGYTVECGLKALILRHEMPHVNSSTVSSFRGHAAHSYDWLKQQLTPRKVSLPSEMARRLANVDWWGTELRYRTGQVERRIAENFLKTVSEIIEWVRGRM
jgi:HEPN domain-containing protein